MKSLGRAVAQTREGQMMSSARTLVIATIAAIFAAPGLAAGPVDAQTAPTTTITVTSIAETLQSADCNDPNAECTLRAALEEANRRSGPDRIGFDIAGGCVAPDGSPTCIIRPTQPLPSITSPLEIAGVAGVVLEGSDVASATCGTNIYGTGAASNGNGLQFENVSATVRSLVVRGFRCNAVFVYRGTGSVLDGVNVTGGQNGVYFKETTNASLTNSVVNGGNNAAVIADLAPGTVIADNRIGTTASGNEAGPDPVATAGAADAGASDAQAGVSLFGSLNSPAPAGVVIRGNTISGRNGAGVSVEGSHDGLVIDDNVIGLRKDLTAALPNSTGIRIEIDPAVAPLIGRTAITRNTISGNRTTAVVVSGPGATGVAIEGNLIGPTSPGGNVIGNSGGIAFAGGAHDNVVGFARGEVPAACEAGSKCNEIAGNEAFGVLIGDGNDLLNRPLGPAGTGNTVRGNAMSASGLGLDVGSRGVTANDSSSTGYDADTGPNALLNAPVGVFAKVAKVNGTDTESVSGLVMSSAPSDLTIDVYAVPPTSLTNQTVLRNGSTLSPTGWSRPTSSRTDPTSYANPGVWVGSTTPRDDGAWRFVRTTPAPAGWSYTATATDAAGNTSEPAAICVSSVPAGPIDSDGDALCDEWERFGIDADRNGTIDHDLPAEGADVNTKDVFVEIDGTDWSILDGAARPGTRLDAVVTAFANAPTGPGQPGRVQLHLSGSAGGPRVDELIPAWKLGGNRAVRPTPTSSWSGTTPVELGDLMFGTSPCDGYFGSASERGLANCATTRTARRISSRYALFAPLIADDAAPLGISGKGDDRLLFGIGVLTPEKARLRCAMGTAAGPGASAQPVPITMRDCIEDIQAAVFMHELGHSLGLDHGGTDDVNFKPNYLSVMNYTYTTRHRVSDRPLDYSRVRLADLDEAQLDETVGLRLANGSPLPASITSNWTGIAVQTNCRTVIPFLSRTRIAVLPLAGGALDWNGDGDKVDTSVSVDLDGGDNSLFCTSRSVLPGPSDWDRLDYNHRDGDLAAPFLFAPDEPEPDSESDPDGDGVYSSTTGVSDDNCPFTANPDQADGDGDGIGDACETLPPSTDLEVSWELVDGLADVEVGDTVTLRAVVTNNGPLPATGISTDIATNGPTSVNVTVSTGTYVIGTGRWTIPTLAVNGRAEATVTFAFTGPTTTRATIVSSTPAYDPSINDRTAEARLAGGVPGVPKLDDPVTAYTPNPTIPKYTGPFFCFPGNDEGTGYDSGGSCFDVNPTPSTATPSPVVEIQPMAVIHAGPGHYVSFQVSFASRSNSFAPLPAVDNGRINVTLPTNARLVGATFFESSLSNYNKGPQSFNPSTGVWRLPPRVEALATMVLTFEPNDEQPIRLQATAPVQPGVPFEAFDSENAFPESSIGDPSFRPTNDEITTATALPLDGSTIIVPTERATTSTPTGPPSARVEELPGLKPVAREVAWTTFEAPSDGVVNLASNGVNGSRSRGMFLWVTDNEVTRLPTPETAAKLSDYFSLQFLSTQTSLRQPVRAGQRYWVATALESLLCCNLFRGPNDVGLSAQFTAAPVNDDFADASLIGSPTASSGSFSADVTAATVEPGEPSARPSVWYRYRATGPGRFVTNGGSVYTGTTLSALTSGAFNATTGESSITLDAGDDAWVQATNSGTFNWRLESDTDGDGIRDATDNCPTTPNQDQRDDDQDGIGNACDPVDTSLGDRDVDGVSNRNDNCVDVYNPFQSRNNSFVGGDACTTGPATSNDERDGALLLAGQGPSATFSPIGTTGAGEQGASTWFYTRPGRDTTFDFVRSSADRQNFTVWAQPVGGGFPRRAASFTGNGTESVVVDPNHWYLLEMWPDAGASDLPDVGLSIVGTEPNSPPSGDAAPVIALDAAGNGSADPLALDDPDGGQLWLSVVTLPSEYEGKVRCNPIGRCDVIGLTTADLNAGGNFTVEVSDGLDVAEVTVRFTKAVGNGLIVTTPSNTALRVSVTPGAVLNDVSSYAPFLPTEPYGGGLQARISGVSGSVDIELRSATTGVPLATASVDGGSGDTVNLSPTGAFSVVDNGPYDSDPATGEVLVRFAPQNTAPQVTTDVIDIEANPGDPVSIDFASYITDIEGDAYDLKNVQWYDPGYNEGSCTGTVCELNASATTTPIIGYFSLTSDPFREYQTAEFRFRWVTPGATTTTTTTVPPTTTTTTVPPTTTTTVPPTTTTTTVPPTTTTTVPPTTTTTTVPPTTTTTVPPTTTTTTVPSPPLGLVTTPIGDATLSSTNGTLTSFASTSSGVAAPSGVVFPAGEFTFTATTEARTPGSLVTFTLTLPEAPTGWYKLRSGVWTLFGPAADGTGATVDGNTVSIVVQDNGRGDDNPILGVVTDPGAPVFEPVTPPTTSTTTTTAPTTTTTTTPTTTTTTTPATTTTTAPNTTTTTVAATTTVPAPVNTGALVFSTDARRTTPRALDGATVSGSIAVVAPNTGQIRRVEFFLDGQLVRTERFGEYDFGSTAPNGRARLWPTRTVSNGPHTITAKITTVTGTVTNQSATFTVDNVRPVGRTLQVSATADRRTPTPLDGASISGNVSVFLPYEGDIDTVAFALDGTLIRTERYAQYDFGSTAPNGTARQQTFSPGNHTITATITFRDGSTDSVTATFSVS
jgi:hypothetical protein